MLLFPQPPMFFLDFPALLRQETRLMGGGERNSWKLNAMCPHEFLRALSSYCATNVCDRNINRSADVLSWVLNLPARQSVITCLPHEEQHTVTPGYTRTRSVTVAALVWIWREPPSLEGNILIKDWLDLSLKAEWTHDVNMMSPCENGSNRSLTSHIKNTKYEKENQKSFSGYVKLKKTNN